MKPSREPNAVRELHEIRRKMLAEEKKVGSAKYWAEANEEGKAFAKRLGLRYVSDPGALAKKGPRRKR